MKNTFDRLTGRVETAKERMCELKDKSAETSQTKMQRWLNKKKEWKSEQNIQKLLENFKKHNIYAIRMPEGGQREKRGEQIFEVIMAKNF